MSLRVLLVADHVVPITGPHRNVLGSVQALSMQSDVQLTVVCGHHEIPKTTQNKIKIETNFFPKKMSKILNNFFVLRKAIHATDVIYVPTGLKTFLYAWLLKGKKPLIAGPNVTGIPVLMHIHNPSPLMTMKMADAWIEMSEVRARQCIKAGTPKDYVSIVPHSVDTDFFSPQLKDKTIWDQYDIPKNSRVIIYTGRIESLLKGIPELIEAFKIIKKDIPDSVLVFVGRIQMDIDEFKKIPGVYFLGPKSGQDFVRHIASADLFMGASRYETFWFCPLEAMACALPVVVTEAGAVPVMIPESGRQGIKVRILTEDDQYLPDAAISLARAALTVLKSPDGGRQMGASARAFVADQFSEKKLGQRLVEVFQKALKKSH